MQRADFFWMAFIAVFLILFFRVIHGPIVSSPNAYIFEDKGDGLRNYFVVADHVKNDTSFWHNGGLNYPYGDHTVHADAMPLFSNTVKLFSGLFPGLKSWTIGLQNLLIIFSYPIGCIFLFLVFRKLGLPGIYAATGSIAVVLLSPHAWRLPWMPALSVTFYFPLLIYLFFSYIGSSQRIKWSVVTGLVVAGSYFMHAYIGLVMSVAIFFLVAAFRIKEFFKGHKLFLLLTDLGIQAILPTLLFVGFMKLSDNHGARITSPDGFFEMTSTLQTILIRYGDNPFKWLHSALGDFGYLKLDTHWEGWAYIGFIATIVFLVLAVRFIFKVIRRNKPRFTSNRAINTLLVVGFLMLLLAMGLPFTLNAFTREMTEFMPVVRQFRSLGRFALFFYFASGVFSVYFLYLVCRKLSFLGMSWIGKVLFFLSTAVMAMEGTDMHRDIARDNPAKQNLFDKQIIDKNESLNFISESLDVISPGQYQALIPLPYFHFGSSIVAHPLDYSQDHFRAALIFSFHSGIPLTACYSTRVPVDESHASMQFFTHSWIDKEIKHDFPDSRPFLALRLNDNFIHPQEAAIWDLGEPVYKNDKITIKAVHWDSLWLDRSMQIEQYFLENRDSFNWQSGANWFSDNPDPLLYFNDFDQFESEQKFNGKGAFQSTHKVPVLLVPVDSLRQKSEGALTVSFWMEGSENRLQADIYIGIEDNNGIRKIRSYNRPIRSYDIYDNWIRCTFDLVPNAIEKGAGIYVQGQHLRQMKFIDELWVQKKGSSVFRLEQNAEGERLWWNNFPVRIISNQR